MRLIKGTRKGNKLAISVALSEVNFCYFKSIAEQYNMSFGNTLNRFLTENVMIEKEMAKDDDCGFEYNLKKERGIIK